MVALPKSEQEPHSDSEVCYPAWGICSTLPRSDNEPRRAGTTLATW
jgi:hypothetical protein